MPSPDTFLLHDKGLNESLAEVLRAYQAEGLSHSAIASRLYAEHDIEVSPGTVRNWIRKHVDHGAPTT